MKANEAKVVTALPVEECAKVFHSAAYARERGGPKIGRKMEFFTPDSTDSPFDVFEEQPTFAVGVLIPKMGLARRYVKGALRGALTGDVGTAFGVRPTAAVHMYVYDCDSHREVELYSPYESMGASESRKLLSRFLDAFTDVDGSARTQHG